MVNRNYEKFTQIVTDMYMSRHSTINNRLGNTPMTAPRIHVVVNKSHLKMRYD